MFPFLKKLNQFSQKKIELDFGCDPCRPCFLAKEGPIRVLLIFFRTKGFSFLTYLNENQQKNPKVKSKGRPG